MDVSESYRGRPSDDCHLDRKVWQADADLAVEWGLSAANDLHFDWAKWPDRSVDAVFFDILWRGQLIFRERILVVDGGRAYLPLPRVAFGPGEVGLEPRGHPMVLGEVAFVSEVARARLVDDLVHGHIGWDGASNFDHYWARSGLLVEPDRDDDGA